MWQSDMRMLDVGCGIGGSAFYVARKYGMLVNGVDLSQNMIDIANERRDEMSAGVKHRVQFHVEDATCMKYPANFYDIVYSRDTILHIEDKESLFRKFLHCLKPGEMHKERNWGTCERFILIGRWNPIDHRLLPRGSGPEQAIQGIREAEGIQSFDREGNTVLFNCMAALSIN